MFPSLGASGLTRPPDWHRDPSDHLTRSPMSMNGGDRHDYFDRYSAPRHAYGDGPDDYDGYDDAHSTYTDDSPRVRWGRNDFRDDNSFDDPLSRPHYARRRREPDFGGARRRGYGNEDRDAAQAALFRALDSNSDAGTLSEYGAAWDDASSAFGERDDRSEFGSAVGLPGRGYGRARNLDDLDRPRTGERQVHPSDQWNDGFTEDGRSLDGFDSQMTTPRELSHSPPDISSFSRRSSVPRAEHRFAPSQPDRRLSRGYADANDAFADDLDAAIRRSSFRNEVPNENPFDGDTSQVWDESDMDPVGSRQGLTRLNDLTMRLAGMKSAYQAPNPSSLVFARLPQSADELDAPAGLAPANPANRLFQTHEHELMDLLEQADTVPSSGSNDVRRARRALVDSIHSQLHVLDDARNAAWSSQMERAGFEGARRYSADLLQHSTRPMPRPLSMSMPPRPSLPISTAASYAGVPSGLAPLTPRLTPRLSALPSGPSALFSSSRLWQVLAAKVSQWQDALVSTIAP